MQTPSPSNELSGKRTARGLPVAAVEGRPRVELWLDGERVEALVDTGASRTLCSGELFARICKRTGRIGVLQPTEPLVAITGHRLDVAGRTEVGLGASHKLKVVVVRGLEQDLVLGDDSLRRLRGRVDYTSDCVILGEIKYPFIGTESAAEGCDTCPVANFENSIIQSNRDIFYEEGHPPGFLKNATPMTIITHSEPIAQRPYRAPLTKWHIIEREVEGMLADGIIRPSSSPWSSPVIVIPKTGTDEYRFVIDYRGLNAVTEKDRYPLPHIQDIFDTVGTGKLFSTLDLKSAYWQLPLAPEAVALTAFTCHAGHYEFLRIPYGLAAAPGNPRPSTRPKRPCLYRRHRRL